MSVEYDHLNLLDALSSICKITMVIKYYKLLEVNQSFTPVEDCLDSPFNQVRVELPRFTALFSPHSQKGDAVLSHDILLGMNQNIVHGKLKARAVALSPAL